MIIEKEMIKINKHNEEHTDSQMVKIEANIDDMSGEWLGYVMEKLLSEGVNDVFYTSIFMKKNRPAIMLSVLCSETDLVKIKNIIIDETTTFGIRFYPLSVYRMGRKYIEIETQWGTVSVKQSIRDNKVYQNSPEYEDCKKLAKQNNIPLKKIYEEVWKNL